jgi:hypothetical protein
MMDLCHQCHDLQKAGVLELDELWVIHLFEADFNLLVGLLFGRRTVHNAVISKRLHPSQFGKKGGECMDAAVTKVLHNTIATFTKTPQGNSRATLLRVLIASSWCSPCFDFSCMVAHHSYWSSGSGSLPTTVTRSRQAMGSPPDPNYTPMTHRLMAPAKAPTEDPEAVS